MVDRIMYAVLGGGTSVADTSRAPRRRELVTLLHCQVNLGVDDDGGPRLTRQKLHHLDGEFPTLATTVGLEGGGVRLAEPVGL